MTIDEIMRNIRAGLAAIPNDVSHVVGNPPALHEIFTPPRHSLAIDPDIPIVVGPRGTGKSFWASVFTDDYVRQQIAPYYPKLRLDDVKVRPGFVDQAISTAISRQTLNDLARDRSSSQAVWPILAIRAAEDVLKDPTFGTMAEGLAVYANSEVRELRLREIDARLRSGGARVIVTFDALDRLSGDWETMRDRTTTLLEALLDMRAYRNIRFKLFLRPEQLGSIPDSFTDLSKLKAGAFDLRWSALDLYGLAYSSLLNEQTSRQAFVELLRYLRLPTPMEDRGRFEVPDLLRRNPEVQEAVFVQIAGQYMGADKRRGKTYAWLTRHLSDTKGRLTPRSFLTALGAAAQYERAPPAQHALSVEGIKHGVSEASILRVDQLKDEYAWIDLALQPLAGQEVPCELDLIFERWRSSDTLDAIASQSLARGYLPPFENHGELGDPQIALVIALMDIGVLELRADRRVNIPDLFRIAALMLRRGGLRPPRN